MSEFHVARLVPKAKRKKKTEAAPVGVVQVHPDVMRTLKSLPGYDPRRVKIIDAETVILEN